MLSRSPSTHKVLPIIAAVILVVVAIVASRSSMNEMHNLRALERVPVSDVSGVLPGPTQLKGYAEAIDSKRVTTPSSNTQVLAYKWTKERRYTDSEGKKKWRVEQRKNESVNFNLYDQEHRILVKVADASTSRVRLHQRWQNREGDLRFTEYQLMPDDAIELYGHINQQGHVELSSPHIEPILTMGTTADVRQSKAGFMLIKFWVSWIAIALAITALLYAFNQHRILVYLSLITVAGLVYLSSLSLNMMKTELTAAHSLMGEQYAHVEQVLAQQGVDIRSQAPNIDMAQYPMYVTLEQRVVQYEQTTHRFPLSILASAWSLNDLPQLARSGQQYDLAFADSALSFGFAPWLAAGSLILGFGLLLLGISLVKEKRQIEAIPTSPAGGAVFGQGEFKGRLEQLADTLTGPLSHADCLWYDYQEFVKIQTKNGHSWKRTLHQKESTPMLLCDQSGKLAIELDDAKIITKAKQQRVSGNKKYVERHLLPGDDIYLLGSAQVVPHRDHQLTVIKGDEQPMIASDYGEFDVMMMQAGKGILSLMIGAMMILGGLLIGFAVTGSLTPFDLVKTALMCPVLLLAVMATLHYNDLVFLRERAKRAWANIEVSLKKRADLLPRLQTIITSAMHHETSTLNAVTALRKQLAATNTIDEVDRLHQYEAKVNRLLEVKIEAYPDLKTNDNLSQMMHQLVTLEDEVGYMREGYVDAATLFNTRLQTMPDNIIAKLARFTAWQAPKPTASRH